MWKRTIRNTLLFFLLQACIEPYDFVIQDTQPGLVVEAYLSDKSFVETLTYPSHGRYAYVKLSYTSDVTNTRPEMVSGATIELVDDTNNKITYVESDLGFYIINDESFKALPGSKYKLTILLNDERKFESSWESLPESRPIGALGFNELEKSVYKYESGQQVIRSVKGIDLYTEVPTNETGETVFYRWDYDFMWIYLAPELSVISPNKKCWIVDPNYLNNYVLRDDRAGGYREPLFFMETVRNDRIYNELSVLVRQKVLTRGHYFFFDEMKKQNQGGLVSDITPFNLKTNIQSLSDDTEVSGYFGIVSENAVRWYFNKDDLSYFVKDTSKEDCNIPFLDQAPQCTNCLLYEYGQATNIEPSWWGK